MTASPRLEVRLESKILAFAKALIDQNAARIIVGPEKEASGYWFGGGNMVRDASGQLWLSGRYRSAGDSRTGLDLGDRGRELAIFRSDDRGASWRKFLAFGKADLGVGGLEVLSIEGSALHFGRDGVELFVSSEKRRPYPPSVEGHEKPGTGVWTIERLAAATVEALAKAAIETFLASDDPSTLHIKDPYIYDNSEGGLWLGFCHHSFSWSSSNSGLTVLDGRGGLVGNTNYDFLHRGRTWDVAISRATSILDLPAIGALADLPRVSLVFYDGGECLRSHEEHAAAAHRPRGHSCEELGGVSYFLDGRVAEIGRLSPLAPAFMSPWGTGSSRYVDVLRTPEGFYATWQQSRPDRSQALVMNFLSMERAIAMLSD